MAEDVPEPVPDPSCPGQFQLNGRELASVFNRELRDAAPGQLRQFLGYKARRYGSELVVLPREEITDRTCSRCGHVQEKIEPRPTDFTCISCGTSVPPGVNGAANVARLTRQQIVENCS